MTDCKNCGVVFDGKHCPGCGQKASVKRIKMEDFYQDTLKKLTHWDQGLGRTAIDVLTRPGLMARDYIRGKRSKYTKPLNFLVLVTAVAFLFFTPEDFNEGIQAMRGGQAISENQKQVNGWIYEHISIVLLGMLPFLAFFTRRFNRKTDVNYAEHLVANTYWLAGAALAGMPLTLGMRLFGILPGSPDALMVQMPFTLLFYAWAYVYFFDKQNNKWAGIQGAFVYIMAYCTFLLAVALVAVVGALIYILIFKMPF
jgi:Protein of unknown function (DUF3667)